MMTNGLKITHKPKVVGQARSRQAAIMSVWLPWLRWIFNGCHPSPISRLTLGCRLYFRLPPLVAREVATTPEFLSSVVKDSSTLLRPVAGF